MIWLYMKDIEYIKLICIGLCYCYYLSNYIHVTQPAVIIPIWISMRIVVVFYCIYVFLPLEIELDKWNIRRKMIMHKVLVILNIYKELGCRQLGQKRNHVLLLCVSPFCIFIKKRKLPSSSFILRKKGKSLSSLKSSKSSNVFCARV